MPQVAEFLAFQRLTPDLDLLDLSGAEHLAESDSGLSALCPMVCSLSSQVSVSGLQVLDTSFSFSVSGSALWTGLRPLT